MAQSSGKTVCARPMANHVGCFAKINAAPRVERAVARNRSDGGLEQNCRRLYRCAFGASRFARRNSLRPCFATRVALRTRAGFQDRHLAKIEATLRWKRDRKS